MFEKRAVIILLLAIAGFAILLYYIDWARRHLTDPEPVTGYWLFGLIIFLAIFNLRKRLSMLPLGKASTWLNLHIIVGTLTLPFFLAHSGTIWPSGIYEKLLATLFYLAWISGVFGFFIQRLYPRILTETGIEVIFERIPAHLSTIRKQAEQIVKESSEKHKTDTLSKHYLDTLEWFFQRPRFALNHAFNSQRSQKWIQLQDSAVRRYLNEEEVSYLDQLNDLAFLKNRIDLHYSLQKTMKVWLLLHVPFTVGMLILATWHLLVVNIYSA